MCRSRRELSNAYLLAKFGFDTAENEPSKVCRPRRPSKRCPARTTSAPPARLCLQLPQLTISFPTAGKKPVQSRRYLQNIWNTLPHFVALRSGAFVCFLHCVALVTKNIRPTFSSHSQTATVVLRDRGGRRWCSRRPSSSAAVLFALILYTAGSSSLQEKRGFKTCPLRFLPRCMKRQTRFHAF